MAGKEFSHLLTKKMIHLYFDRKKSFDKIGKLIGCCGPTVRYRIVKSGLTPRKQGEYCTDLKNDFDISTIELAQFLGNVAGDGCVQKYAVGYTNFSKEAAERFRFIVKKQFDIHTGIYRRKVHNVYLCMACSKNLAIWVKKMFAGKVKHNVVCLPNIVVVGDTKFKSNFLAYLFGDDGSFSVDAGGHHRLSLYSSSECLIFGIKKILKNDFSIESKIRKPVRADGRVCYYLNVDRLVSILRFQQKINFSPYSKFVRGKNCGLFKKDVLDEWAVRRYRVCVDCERYIFYRPIQSNRCKKCAKIHRRIEKIKCEKARYYNKKNKKI